jgi:alcohol dehydrogenase (cytochrome c)
MSKKNFALASIVSLLISVACAPPAPLNAQGTTGVAGDWPSYNRTVPGDRFSPLTEIDRSNVARLKSICTYTLPEVTSLQTGPIVVGGTMFFTTDTISYAIDAGNCTEKWKKVRHSDGTNALEVNRGSTPRIRVHERQIVSRHIRRARLGDGCVGWSRDLGPSTRRQWTGGFLSHGADCREWARLLRECGR